MSASGNYCIMRDLFHVPRPFYVEFGGELSVPLYSVPTKLSLVRSPQVKEGVFVWVCVCVGV